MSYKDCLKQAKTTYKSQEGSGAVCGKQKVHPEQPPPKQEPGWEKHAIIKGQQLQKYLNTDYNFYKAEEKYNDDIEDRTIAWQETLPDLTPQQEINRKIKATKDQVALIMAESEREIAKQQKRDARQQARDREIAKQQKRDAKQQKRDARQQTRRNQSALSSKYRQRGSGQRGGFGLIDFFLPKPPGSFLMDRIREEKGLPPMYDPRKGILRAGMAGMDIASGGVTTPGTMIVNTLL